MTKINIQNLSVNYGFDCVLNNINLTTDEGEFIVIVGKSGCGKTTFLNALANFIPFIGNVEVPSKKGMIFQQHSIFPWMTVSENILFGIENLERKEDILEDLLQITNLKKQRSKYPSMLSGGQIQRVALARSIAPSPELLLMDEPFGALDYYTRAKMQEWLLKFWLKYKITIIFVTHDIEEAIFLGDKIFVLDEGKLKEEIKIPFLRPRLPQIRFSAKFNEIRKDILNNF